MAAARRDPTLSRLANEAWEALFRAQATLAREFEQDGGWDGFPPREYGVLYALASHERTAREGQREGLRITDLIEDALLTQAGVSRLVARLEARGLVERRDDPDDARASRIVLTSEGRSLQRRLGAIHARHVAEAMTRTLDADRLRAVRDLSRALIAPAPSTTRPPITPGSPS